MLPGKDGQICLRFSFQQGGGGKWVSTPLAYKLNSRYMLADLSRLVNMKFLAQ
jgi:hypothetical protein